MQYRHNQGFASGADLATFVMFNHPFINSYLAFQFYSHLFTIYHELKI